MTNTEELRALAAIGGKAASKGATPEDSRITNIVQAALQGLVREQEPQRVYVVKIDNWFSQKWRGFGCKYMGALGATWKREFPIPPFHPNRVRAQWQFGRLESGSFGPLLDAAPIHVHQTSEKNARRRMYKRQTPQVWLWYSGNTVRNDRASLMVYVVRGIDDDEAWYVEYTKRSDEWRVSKLIGVDRSRLDSLVATRDQSVLPWPGPASGTKEAFERLLEINPDDVAALDGLSRILAYRKPKSASVPVCERLLELAPGNSLYWVRLGHALTGAGDLERAEVVLRRSVEMAPMSPMAWNYLGYCLDRQDKLEEAEGCYRKAAQLHPKYASPIARLGHLLRWLKRYKEAEPLLRRAVKIEREQPQPLIWLARLLAETDRKEEAQAAARSAIALASTEGHRERIAAEFLK